MRLKFFSLFVLVSIFSVLNADDSKEESALRPLAKIKDFEVVPVFSLFEPSNHEFLFNSLVCCLETIGRVKIIKEDMVTALPDHSTMLLLSLGGYKEVDEGSIQIISPVLIEANQCMIYASIWTSNFKQKNLPHPTIIDGKVAFQKNDASEIKSTPETILRELIAQFSEEYFSANPGSEKPTFRVYTSEFTCKNH